MICLMSMAVSIAQKNYTKDSFCCCKILDYVDCAGTGDSIIQAQFITLDFKTKNIAFPKKANDLKKGSAIRVRVVNYNPYLYNIVVNNVDSTNYAFTDGKLLGWFLDPSNLGTIAANIPALSITPSIQSAVSKFSPQEIYTFNSTIKSRASDSTAKKISKFLELSSTIPKFSDELTNSLLLYRNKTIASYFSIDSLTKQISDALYGYSRMSSFLSTKYPQCSMFTGINDSITKMENGFSNLRDVAAQKKKGLINDKNEYMFETFPQVLDVLKKDKDNSEVRTADSLIRLFYTQAEIFITKIDSTLSYKTQKQFIDAIEPLQLLSSCYTSFPIFYTDDFKKISIEVKPWKDSLRLTSYKTEFTLPFQPRTIWGVSGGIYGSSLHNKGYSLLATPVGTDTTYSLKEDGVGNGEFGISALAYVGFRINTSSLYIGPSFGAGMTIENKPNPRILLGLSIISGTKNRITVSLGLNAGYVQRLSSIYENNMTNLKPKPINYMKDVISSGVFLSINYSFLSK